MRNVALALLTAVLTFVALYTYVIFKVAPKTQVQQRLRNLKRMTSQGGTNSEEALENASFTERMIVPFFRRIEKFLSRFAPEGIHALLERKIMLAGKQYVWTISMVASVWLTLLVLGFVAGVYLIAGRNLNVAQNMVVLLLFAGIGGALPFLVLNQMIRTRRKLILKQLPEVLDLLCVSVQAGLSFDGSMQKIVDRMAGAFVEECRKMLHDVRMGMTRHAALQNMAKRCDIQEVHLFTTAIIQAEHLGTSMSQTLVNQANNVRERRRQAAKAEALRAPIKIIFPLVLFIFPALFVVVLLPTLLNLLATFHL